MRQPQLRLATAIAAVLLLALGTAMVEAAFVHTDDGCRVETHCLACRWALGGTAVVAVALSLDCSLQVTEAALAPPLGTAIERASEAPSSRGPPVS